MRATTLKIERIKRGLRQIEVAQAAGIARCRLSEAENGYYQLRRDEVERVAAVLGVATETLTQESEVAA